MLNKLRLFFAALGPGFIIASVVIGPGSITTSSKIGADYGYAFLWLIVFTAIAMGTYTTMSARFGVTHEKSILQTIAEVYGRWFAALIGVAAFTAATSFQFGNNLGVATAMDSLTGIPARYWPWLFTPFAVALVLWARNLYTVLEKMMIVLVSTMIGAFMLNLFFAKPEAVGVLRGFLPSQVHHVSFNEMAAIVGTTFVLHVCLYQSYLVQKKGWSVDQYKQGLRDTYSGIFMLSLITMLIIMTSAAVLNPRGIKINSAADMAIQLETLLGPAAKYLFSVGLWAAAFSSLVGNAIMAGGLLADGLGFGKTMEQRGPRIATVVCMLIGMFVAIFFSGNPIPALILAQASSLFGVPAIAIGLFLIVNNKKVMGKFANSWKQNLLAVFGFVLMMIMVYYMYNRLIGFLNR